jgi:protein-tyrosine phosphatase
METKILMVCLGNICRSPIAEGVMKAAFRKYNIPGSVDSAGVLSYHSGHAPDKRAVRISSNYGVDISSQLARQIRKSDFDEFDFIFTMDQSVQKSIMTLAPSESHRKKVYSFMEFAGYPEGSEVPDPYYSGIEAFEQVFEMVDEACEKIIRKWYPNL